jgi:hypothetical protein
MKEVLMKKVIIPAFVICVGVVSLAAAQAPSNQELDARLRAVESYLDKLPPSLATYTGSLEESINRYTKNLEAGLEKYSDRLENSLESKLLGISNKTIELDINSRAYKKIDTPTGMFFVALRDYEAITGGYRLHLQIGNPNYADFRDFTIRLVWGQTWNAGSRMTFEQWRESLTGAQYSFKGKLERGKWNSVEVDLIPAKSDDLAYIECELGVASIELEVR